MVRRRDLFGGAGAGARGDGDFVRALLVSVGRHGGHAAAAGSGLQRLHGGHGLEALRRRTFDPCGQRGDDDDARVQFRLLQHEARRGDDPGAFVSLSEFRFGEPAVSGELPVLQLDPPFSLLGLALRRADRLESDLGFALPSSGVQRDLFGDWRDGFLRPRHQVLKRVPC